MAKNKPIRVAQIIGKWLGGGVEAVVMNYYRNIDRSKVQFDFICDDDSTDIPYEEIKKLGGKVILVPPYQKVFKYHKELKRVLKEGNYKIVHSNINALSVFPLYAAKKAGVPIRIAHSHSTSNKKEWKKTLVKNMLRPFSKVYANSYMACTEHAGRWLFGNKAFDQNDVYVLNNAIDLENFRYDENERKNIRKELSIDDNTFVIGHIGRFVRQKNHDFLIDVFNEVHKTKENSMLLLVGQGPLVEQMKTKVESLGLKNCVQFVGQRNDVARLYQAFDYFLFPSLYEGLGMVAIEAQCSGLPCLCSTEVPVIAKATDNIKFLALDDDLSKWRDEIIDSSKDYVRTDCSGEVSKHGYNIKEEAKKLEEKYIKYCR